MNSKFTQKAWLTGRLIDFLFHSGNRHRIHSPFLYSFIDEVIREDKPVAGGEQIELLRRECMKSNEIIKRTDYGEGGKHQPGIIYPVALRQITRNSLTSPRHARRLYQLARFIKAGQILEIGTSLGITTAYLALANPGARIITLEGCPELCRKAREHFNRLGISNIEVLEGRFEDTLPEALQQLGSVDLVFIDGNHINAAMIDYYEKCLGYANNDTVMVFDDIRASAGMEEAWEQVRQRPEARISLDLFLSGWVFCRKESSRQHFKLRYI